MDDRRFDSFARSLAGGLSRRRVVAGLAASAGVWLTPRSSRLVTAQSETGAGADEEGNQCIGTNLQICRMNCTGSLLCNPADCHCIQRDAIGVTILSDASDSVAVAFTTDTTDLPRVELQVTRNCDSAGCSGTIDVFETDGTTTPLTAEAHVSRDQVVSLRFVGSGVDYLATVDPKTGEIETTTGKGPPVHGAYDPETGNITGLGNGLILPDDVAALIAPLAPALEALVGGAVLGSGGLFCPPGPTRPDRPAPAGTPVPTPDDPCPADCQFGVAVAVAACCGENADLACLLCAATGASAEKAKKGYIGQKGGHAMPAADPDITGEAGPTPMSTPTPAPAGKKNKKGYITQQGGHAAPAGPVEETVPTSTPSPTAAPTPAGPIACGANELPCADRCIPASECPVESCCLSPESCACVCPDCGDHGDFDPTTCRCACNADARPCAEGCLPIAECPPESCCLSAETCLCTCPDCGPNGAFDPTTCGCTCGQVACPPNFVLDEAACSCVCGMTECAPNHVWDLEACTCTCVPQECPANQVFDESLCGCVCGLGGCPPNYVFDEANCACICTAECPPTFVFDEATCSCLCLLEGCPPNLTFTPESCACYCEPPACPPRYVVDQASCTCFCPEVGCPEGQVFDLASCACVGSRAAGAVEGSG